MATIFIDYENVVSSNGLKGVEYLTSTDSLRIFYSQACCKIKSEYLDEINKSGCSFEICKLLHTGKNHLDFYIATEVGIVSQQGATQILIVSKDKGFQAIADYFKVKNTNVNIFIAPNIENGLILLNAPEDAKRSEFLADKTKSLDLATEYAKIEERSAMKNKISTVFSDAQYETFVPRIIDSIDDYQKKTLKELYCTLLHDYGRTNGIEIYRILKNILYEGENKT